MSHKKKSEVKEREFTDPKSPVPVTQPELNFGKAALASASSSAAPYFDIAPKRPSLSPWTSVTQVYSSLKNTPVLKVSDYLTYKSWKSELENWAGQRGSVIWDTISVDATIMEQKAIQSLTSIGYSHSDATEFFRDLSKRLWSCLAAAIKPAFGTTLVDTIQTEQDVIGPVNSITQFKAGNANELWKRVKDTLENKSNFAALPILREIITITHDRKQENPVQYGQRIQSLFHRYHTITKESIPPGMRAALLINGLPKSYDVVVDAYMASHSHPDILTLIPFLQAHYERTYSSKPGSQAPGINSQTALSAVDDSEEEGDNFEDDTDLMASTAEQRTNYKSNNKGRNRIRWNKKDPKGHKTDKTPNDEEISFVFMDRQADPTVEAIFALCGTSTSDEENDETDTYTVHNNTDQMLSDIIVGRTNELILDSAASRHVVFDERLLENIQDIDPFHIYSATGHHSSVRKVGRLRLSEKVLISNMFVVKGATHNLISLGRLLDGGAEVETINPTNITVKRKITCTSGKTTTVKMSFNRNIGGVYRMKLPEYSRRRIVRDEPFVVRSIKPKSDKEPDSQTARRELTASRAQSSRSLNSSTVPANPNLTVSSKASSTPNNSKAVAPKPASNNAAPVSQANMMLYFSDDSNTDGIIDPSPLDDNLIAEFYQQEENTARLWHCRLGHQNTSVLSEMNRAYDLKITQEDLKQLSNCQCDICIRAKGRRTKVGDSRPEHLHATTILHRIHFDLVGAMSVWDGYHKNRIPTTIGGNLYALVVTDEYSRLTAVKLIKFKDDASGELIDIIENWENLTGKRVKFARCDGGGEFINNALDTYLKEKGIKLNYTTARSPFHNGIAERMNGWLCEMARAMIIQAGAPLGLWGEALNYASFIHNNSVQPSIGNQIPFEVFYGRRYPAKKMRVFGCDAFVYLDESIRGKFQDRFRRGVFVGYDTTQDGFRILDPETNRLTVSRDVKTIETSFKMIQNDAEVDYDQAGNNIVIVTTPEMESSLPTEENEHIPSQPNPDDTTYSATSEQQPAEFKSEDTGTDELKENSGPTASAPNNQLSIEPAPSPPSVPETIQPSPAINNSPVDEEKQPPTVNQRNPVTRQTRELRNLTDALSNKFALRPTTRNATQKAPTRQTNNSSLSRAVVQKTPHSYRHGFNRESKETIAALTEIDGKISMETILISAELDDDTFEPKTYKQATRCKNSPRWMKSVEEELAALEANGTWAQVPAPENAPVITAKWVFKVKLDSENRPVRYKARLVARGFQQEHGISYDETFAPVVKYKSIKIVLSITANRDMELKQIDFDTAYLNATLSHDVYMQMPEGSNYPKGTVLKLVKSLYGLKQAGHDWHEIARDLLLNLNYEQLECDKCVFLKYTSDDRFIILTLYVDDTIAAYDKKDESVWLSDKETIGATYKIKDIGDCEWILNMKVVRNREAKTIHLSQEAYIQRVLLTYGYDQSIPLVTPGSDIDLFLPPPGSDITPLGKVEQNLYQSIVGSLSYAAMCTRPDISFAVNELSRFQAQATQCQLQQAQRVLRYLKGTSNYGLEFKPQANPMSATPEIYVDSSWANDLETRRSTTGILALFNGNAITWASKKQKTVATSSTEAEYMACAEAAKEALWLRTWINEVFRVEIPVTMYCDNRSSIDLAKNDTFHQRTKHIDISHHFIREKVIAGQVKQVFVPSENNLADILTKNFSSGVKFKDLRDRTMVQIR